MGKLEGKVAFISGVARGQGRSHAVHLASEGARIIGFDLCDEIASSPFPLASKDDLEETKRLVEEVGGEAVLQRADVRDSTQVARAFEAGLAQFGRVDIVVANAGIVNPLVRSWEMEEDAFRNTIDVNLIGPWRTIKTATPTLIEQGEGGAIVVIGSGASLKGLPNLAPYTAAKHGVIGLVRTIAKELAPHRVRVNAVLPGNTDTPMLHNEAMHGVFMPDVESPSQEQYVERLESLTPLHVPYVEPIDISEAILYLVADSGRYVTGTMFSVDGGMAIP